MLPEGLQIETAQTCLNHRACLYTECCNTWYQRLVAWRQTVSCKLKHQCNKCTYMVPIRAVLYDHVGYILGYFILKVNIKWTGIKRNLIIKAMFSETWQHAARLLPLFKGKCKFNYHVHMYQACRLHNLNGNRKHSYFCSEPCKDSPSTAYLQYLMRHLRQWTCLMD